jgi:hypothetical protein
MKINRQDSEKTAVMNHSIWHWPEPFKSRGYLGWIKKYSWLIAVFLLVLGGMVECALSSQDPADEPVVLVLRPWGFEIREITRPHGDFLLIINNRAGLKNLSVRFDKGKFYSERKEETKVHANTIKKESPDLHDWIKLDPGTYLLSVDGHPDWVCQFTITSNNKDKTN